LKKSTKRTLALKKIAKTLLHSGAGNKLAIAQTVFPAYPSITQSFLTHFFYAT